jgi:hypothetical protein
MKAYGSGCIDSHFLDLGTSWRWVVNFTPWPLYPRGKSPGTHWIGGTWTSNNSYYSFFNFKNTVTEMRITTKYNTIWQNRVYIGIILSMFNPRNVVQLVLIITELEDICIWISLFLIQIARSVIVHNSVWRSCYWTN